MTGVRLLSVVWIALCVLFGATRVAHAQTAKGVGAAAAGMTAAGATFAPAEEEAADSPRASMRAFYDLCDRGRFEEAAHYLDVPRGAEKRTAELTHRLYDVLQERLWIDPERLSPLAAGKKEDALPAGTEELGKIADSKGHLVSIRLVRHESRSPEDEPRWLFSQASVLSIDSLHASLKGKWIRDHLPAALLQQAPLALYYWQWIAIPLLAALCVGAGRIAATATQWVTSWLTAKREWGPRLVKRLTRPATMGFALALFWLLLPYLALTLRAEDLAVRILRSLGWLAFFWALLRTVTIAGDEIAAAKWEGARSNIQSITGIGVRLGKLVVGAIALMVALSQLGYPVTTVIAGLGIGGVALALAAQKTVENLFGSVSILVDQPFGVGDTIRVDGVEGTVETIGLRSTRMRTQERTLVIIPNGKLADMRIESLGSRDRIRFSTKLALSRQTTLPQIEAVLTTLRTMLGEHSSVHAEEVSVRLGGFGEFSFDLDVSAPVETKDPVVFAKIKEDLLLVCVRAVGDAGATLAVPTRHIVSARPD